MVKTPEGLRPNQRAAWEVLAHEGTHREAAEAAGVGRSTVSHWLRSWRDTYGDDPFEPGASASPEQEEWAELRRMEARNLGVTASQIRAHILAILGSTGTRRVDRGPDGQSAPIVVEGPDAGEVKSLADAAVRLLEAADRLALPQAEGVWSGAALGVLSGADDATEGPRVATPWRRRVG